MEQRTSISLSNLLLPNAETVTLKKCNKDSTKDTLFLPKAKEITIAHCDSVKSVTAPLAKRINYLFSENGTLKFNVQPDCTVSFEQV